MEKPISIRMEETKKEIVNKINESDLPINVIEIILRELYSAVQTENMKMYIEDVQKYENFLKEKSNM